MELIVGGLPPEASTSDLSRFFRGYGYVRRFEILEQAAAGGPMLRYGIGTVEPDWAALHAVRRLNRKSLLGTPVAVREYVPRDGGGDRRHEERRTEGAGRRGRYPRDYL